MSSSGASPRTSGITEGSSRSPVRSDNSGQSGDVRRVHQPHSMANKKINLESMWEQMEPGLRTVFELKKMDKHGYMTLYSVVYSYCTSILPSVENGDGKNNGNLQTRPSGRKGAPAAAQPSPSHQAAWIGMELYKKLREFVASTLVEVLEKLREHRGEDLLTNYCKQWNNFRFCAGVTHGMCMYLNRHWVKRENDEGRHKDIYPVYGMCLIQWRESVFNPLEQRLSREVLDLIESDRNGDTINSQLIRNVVDNLVELGVTTEAEDESFRKGEKELRNVGLQVYKTAFEARFIEETTSYYANESHNFLQGNPVNEYIKKVQTRLAEEEMRATKYLHELTMPLLKKTLEDVLIVRHLEIFHNEFINLLAQEKVQELSAMYSLLVRVPHRIDDLHKLVEEHIKSHGGESLLRSAGQILRSADQQPDDHRTFVMVILDIYDRSTKLINGAFKDNIGFSVAMDKAFSYLVNTNAITIQSKNSSKVPELLAGYCDQVLKKSTKNPDEAELEEALNRVMIVFKYVEEKDVFQKFYSKMLAKRLVQGLSASDDAEATMISRLKGLCGFEYTAKLQRMFQDIGVSRDLNEQFRHHLDSLARSDSRGRTFDYEFTVQVLSTGAWPFSERTLLNLPVELERPVNTFKDFYQNKYSGRRLTWLYNLSRCELNANCFNNKYILQVSTYQAAILILYNTTNSISVEQIGQMVNCDQPLLNQVLIQLLKKRVLILKDKNEQVEEKDLEAETQVKLNMAFTSKQLKINLNKAIRAEQKLDEEATKQVIDEDRKIVIQATIVRIMKMRKQLKHQTLIGETMQMVANRFKPSVPLIKRCVEILIQKEYMKRDEDSKDLYTYIA